MTTRIYGTIDPNSGYQHIGISYEPTPDYTAEMVAELDTALADITRLYQQHRQHIWDIGSRLADLKRRYPQQWLAFCERLPFSHDTARRWMNIHRKLPRPVVDSAAMPSTVLYALTSERIPAQVVADSLNARVGCAEAVDLLAKTYTRAPQEYQDMIAAGGFYIDADYVPLADARPRDVRAYEKAVVAANIERRYPYRVVVAGRVEKRAGGLYIALQDMPADFVEGNARVTIQVEA